jgi:hypothetical protein
VQGILEAAEATAADIEQKASEDARRTRAEADSDAERTRANAVERAQAHVAAVAQATAVLIERVESMDGEASTLVESLRAGAGRLSGELTTVETNMAELYDAAAGRGAHAPEADPPPAVPLAQAGDSGPDAPVRQGHSEFIPAPPVPVPASAPPAPATSTTQPSPPAAAVPAMPPALSPPVPPRSEPRASDGNGDLDGARLIALNMALNGDSRAATDRYLAEHYELSDRQQLLDEVYAVIEG